MAKFHINRQGVPAPCKARKGRCPFGTSDTHFGSQEEAQAYIGNLNEEQFGMFKEVRNEDTVENYNEYYESILFTKENNASKMDMIEDGVSVLLKRPFLKLVSFYTNKKEPLWRVLFCYNFEYSKVFYLICEGY